MNSFYKISDKAGEPTYELTNLLYCNYFTTTGWAIGTKFSGRHYVSHVCYFFPWILTSIWIFI